MILDTIGSSCKSKHVDSNHLESNHLHGWDKLTGWHTALSKASFTNVGRSYSSCRRPPYAEACSQRSLSLSGSPKMVAKESTTREVGFNVP